MPRLPDEMALPPEMLPAQPPDPPAPARDSATVALLSDGVEDGLEVFVLRRAVGMDFAGGMTVFPGGGVDRRDSDTSVAWSGPEPAWWARQLGCDAVLARALVCAAVRETFEECGVLLAAPESGTATVVEDAGRYREARAALAEREVSLAQFLAQHRLVLRADLLRPWSHWVTPVEEPRRYDTRFFLAALPGGQRADGATSEATEAGWYRPRAVLDEWADRRVGLLPPTWMTLAELDECRDVAEALAAPRVLEPILPQLKRTDDVVQVVLPGDPRYECPVERGES